MNRLVILILTLAFSHAEQAIDTTTQLSKVSVLGKDYVTQGNSVPVTVRESSLDPSTLTLVVPSKSESLDIPKVSERSHEVLSEESATVSSENSELPHSSEVEPVTEIYTGNDTDNTNFAVPLNTEKIDSLFESSDKFQPLSLQTESYPTLTLVGEPTQSSLSLNRDPSSHITVVNRVPSIDQSATIVHRENKRHSDGSYKNGFETSNGILFQEEGVQRNYNKTDINTGKPIQNIVVKGAFGWTAPDGQKIAIKYYADETGYHPEGSILPTPPPTPPEILKALTLIRKLQAAKQEKELKPKDEYLEN